MASYLHDWGQAGRSFVSPGKLGAEKEAEEVGDATTLFLHRREGCLANSPSSLQLSKANKQYQGKTVGLNRRAREAKIDNKLMNDIETNPGPRTTLQKAARTRRRLKKRIEKRSHKRKRKEEQWANAELKVATWNVRRANIYKSRFGEILKECIERGWDIVCVCVSELNARADGIRRYTHGGKRRCLVHSRKCGILMTENVFNVREMQGKRWQPNDRLTMVEFSSMIVVSVYHPVRGSSGYEYELANIRSELDRQVNTVTSKRRILIRGDFNAQIGQTSRHLLTNANNGSFGFRSTNIQGEELQEWIIGNELCWVNSFFFQKKRGTWWNPGLKKWYEIDGFITKARYRHDMIRSFKVEELKPFMSDHKPVEIKLKVIPIKLQTKKLMKMKQKIRQPNIKWERLMDDECADQFREKTSERVEKCLCEIRGVDWNQVEKILRETALEVCGKQTSQVNPWMEEHHTEVEKLKENIREGLRKRNEIKRKATDEYDQSLIEAREELRQARRAYKNQLKEWEEQWWDQKAEECRIACEEGKIGVMYDLLKQLQR